MSVKYNASISVAFHNHDQKKVAVAAGLKDRKSGAKTAPEDVFVWGSVTKVHTGSSVLKLVSDGAFSLDDSIVPLIDPMVKSMKAGAFSSLVDLFGPDVHKVTVRRIIVFSFFSLLLRLILMVCVMCHIGIYLA